jgi:hypothetical protein
MRRPTQLALALFASLARMPAALAEPEPASTDTPVVEIAIAASDADADAFKGVVRDLLERLHVELHFARIERVDPHDVVSPRRPAEHEKVPVARVWLDLETPTRATLYVVDQPWERILVRHVPRPADREEVTREALGHILETAVEALLHGGRLGISREEAEPLLVPPRPHNAPTPARTPLPDVEKPPAPPTPLRFELGALYEAGSYAKEAALAHGPELSFVVERRSGSLRPGAWLTAQYRLPLIADFPSSTGARLDVGALRLLASADVDWIPTISLRFGIGGGLDVVHLEPRAGSATTTLAPAQTFAIPIVRLDGAIRWALAEDLAALFGLALDVDGSGTRYTVERTNARETVLSPWPVRPALFVGISAP